MSVTAHTTAAVAVEKPIVDLRGMWIGLALLDGFDLLVRIFEQI